MGYPAFYIFFISFKSHIYTGKILIFREVFEQDNGRGLVRRAL
ncbi:hypothetical protein HMPREF0083_06223 [Aneurinibacillus aneurinilyticus ATCC 12856]|uniref:Uncharacterized protein n=1 Tax=Aneurinibacillus aneurinilyticus ATCC 12856 TaxID=649747 RepID=U1WMS4_ANEAE|nr:hypothetical protein HMPREF0083_06223 [Aneurinibacillus aneurinilyticus ATCC 12856]